MKVIWGDYWESVWKDENGKKVRLNENFFFRSEGSPDIRMCIMHYKKSGGGHGEGTWMTPYPVAYNRRTLEKIELDFSKIFIEPLESAFDDGTWGE